MGFLNKVLSVILALSMHGYFIPSSHGARSSKKTGNAKHVGTSENTWRHSSRDFYPAQKKLKKELLHRHALAPNRGHREKVMNSLKRRGNLQLKELKLNSADEKLLIQKIEFYYVDALRHAMWNMLDNNKWAKDFHNDLVDDFLYQAVENVVAEINGEKPANTNREKPVNLEKLGVMSKPSIDWLMYERQTYVISGITKEANGEYTVDIQLKYGVLSQSGDGFEGSDIKAFDHLPITLKGIRIKEDQKLKSNFHSSQHIKDVFWPVGSTLMRTHRYEK